MDEKIEYIKVTKYHVEMIVEVITNDEEGAGKFIRKQIKDGLEGVHDIKNFVVHKIDDKPPF